MSQKNEIRKPVEGYEDRYEISNFGRLYSKKTKRFLTGKINSSGYLQFTLTVGKIEKKFLRTSFSSETFYTKR